MPFLSTQVFGRLAGEGPKGEWRPLVAWHWGEERLETPMHAISAIALWGRTIHADVNLLLLVPLSVGLVLLLLWLARNGSPDGRAMGLGKVCPPDLIRMCPKGAELVPMIGLRRIQHNIPSLIVHNAGKRAVESRHHKIFSRQV